MKHLETALAGKRIPRAEFEAVTQCLSSAEAKAQDLVADARKEAERIMAEAHTRLRSVNAQVREAERRLRNASAKRALEHRNSSDAAASLKAARDVLAEFDRATPWLVELVSVSVHKIIGELSPADVLSATVVRCVQDMKSTHKLILRCAASDFDLVTAIMREKSDAFEAVSQVCADPDLAEGVVCLDGRGGFANIGVEAQLDCLLREIETACAECET